MYTCGTRTGVTAFSKTPMLELFSVHLHQFKYYSEFLLVLRKQQSNSSSTVPVSGHMDFNKHSFVRHLSETLISFRLPCWVLCSAELICLT